MTFEELVNFRRSIRHYKPVPIDSQKVKRCLELASLAPNSSNMQLWEFYHITHPEVMQEMAVACLNQNTAKTAQQFVVFVTRQDLHRKRAKTMLALETQNILKNSPKEKQEKYIKQRKLYYGTAMPFLYSRFFGLWGLLRKLLVNVVGLFRPMFYQAGESDMRVVVHKSCALAAQTFMLGMAELGYDTCPMEGFDSRRVKRLLQLPYEAEVNMIISCGIREQKGVWGERMRVPFEDIYKMI
jgi:nitroreductase